MEIIRKLSAREKNLLFILLIFIILFCSYQFGYVKLAEKIDILSSKNLELNVKLNDLNQKNVAKEKYIEETNKMITDTKDMFNHLASSMSQDKNTIFVTKLEKEADMIVSAITFGEITQIYDWNETNNTDNQIANDPANVSNTTEVIAEGKNLKGYQSSITLNYQTNYAGLKKAIDFINNYHEKMRIQSITAAFDSSTGNLTGTITIDLFMLSGKGKEPEPFDINGIELGTENIFGTFELP